jgi:hypothetical protein
MTKIAVTMATLESHNHIVDDIERGVKIFNSGGVEISNGEGLPFELSLNSYLAKVPHKKYNETKTVRVSFSKDGQDIADFYCDCARREGKNPPLCRHVVAAVLALRVFPCP